MKTRAMIDAPNEEEAFQENTSHMQVALVPLDNDMEHVGDEDEEEEEDDDDEENDVQDEKESEDENRDDEDDEEVEEDRR